MASLRAAINEAMRMTWDESIGYTFGGDGNPDSNGYDCSAFVIRSLYRAGFDVPSHRVGTAYMKPVLVSAGFTIIPADSQSPDVLPGDILVYTHYSDLAHEHPDAGHTKFYMEDVRAYTDSSANSDHTGTVHRVFIEAASSRDHTGSGDSKKNGTGAYWEVWTHAFSGEMIPSSEYDVTSAYVDAYIARWPGGLDGVQLPYYYLFQRRFLKRRKKHA